MLPAQRKPKLLSNVAVIKLHDPETCSQFISCSNGIFGTKEKDNVTYARKLYVSIAGLD